MRKVTPLVGPVVWLLVAALLLACTPVTVPPRPVATPTLAAPPAPTIEAPPVAQLYTPPPGSDFSRVPPLSLEEMLGDPLSGEALASAWAAFGITLERFETVEPACGPLRQRGLFRATDSNGRQQDVIILFYQYPNVHQDWQVDGDGSAKPAPSNVCFGVYGAASKVIVRENVVLAFSRTIYGDGIGLETSEDVVQAMLAALD